ncbi:LOW QUALITY PROTEIN: hypothetical protein BU14_1919s0001 [Porphyra umbilicalis]|uniref:Uncharacterized protein n=1 Tax=Porphyra umbilicalis TaxID=2786 RepID=A0A1X6NKP8_PORUM|nr:LOW QUALITY PROTEIN: hypothetical protein BU14_1919s0001 [Porphyra umbilicalis]|eukprot:OSX69056.1 LOW QUALITY PROTEIN: hypothetical protein BU14_1919s0001 [Porphyra umbilicalis]
MGGDGPWLDGRRRSVAGRATVARRPPARHAAPRRRYLLWWLTALSDRRRTPSRLAGGDDRRPASFLQSPPPSNNSCFPAAPVTPAPLPVGWWGNEVALPVVAASDRVMRSAGVGEADRGGKGGRTSENTLNGRGAMLGLLIDLTVEQLSLQHLPVFERMRRRCRDWPGSSPCFWPAKRLSSCPSWPPSKEPRAERRTSRAVNVCSSIFFQTPRRSCTPFLTEQLVRWYGDGGGGDTGPRRAQATRASPWGLNRAASALLLQPVSSNAIDAAPGRAIESHRPLQALPTAPTRTTATRKQQRKRQSTDHAAAPPPEFAKRKQRATRPPPPPPPPAPHTRPERTAPPTAHAPPASLPPPHPPHPVLGHKRRLPPERPVRHGRQQVLLEQVALKVGRARRARRARPQHVHDAVPAGEHRGRRRAQRPIDAAASVTVAARGGGAGDAVQGRTAAAGRGRHVGCIPDRRPATAAAVAAVGAAVGAVAVPTPREGARKGQTAEAGDDIVLRRKCSQNGTLDPSACRTDGMSSAADANVYTSSCAKCAVVSGPPSPAPSRAAAAPSANAAMLWGSSPPRSAPSPAAASRISARTTLLAMIPPWECARSTTRRPRRRSPASRPAMTVAGRDAMSKDRPRRHSRRSTPTPIDGLYRPRTSRPVAALRAAKLDSTIGLDSTMPLTKYHTSGRSAVSVDATTAGEGGGSPAAAAASATASTAAAGAAGASGGCTRAARGTSATAPNRSVASAAVTAQRVTASGGWPSTARTTDGRRRKTGARSHSRYHPSAAPITLRRASVAGSDTAAATAMRAMSAA